MTDRREVRGTGPVPRRARLTLRTRLVAIYAVVFVLSMAAVLGVSYLLLSNYLHDTLEASAADGILERLASKYLLALIGTTLVATSLGWLAARRLLQPIQAVTDAARHASDDRLDQRLDLGGPHDELRELGDTFDAMLDRFQDSIEAQRRFIANASHELRSPLTAIRTEVDVTLADPDATVADLRRMGERVLQGGDELDELLAALMVLARSQRGLLATDRLDLAQVASLALADVSAQAHSAKVELDVHLESAPVLGDPALLRRLIANLIDNGIRYNRPGGTVAITVGTITAIDRPSDGSDGVATHRPTVRVTNTGLVVPPESVERLRQPFERLGRHGSGSGLGLSIVQAVAEAHEGSVWLAADPAGGLDVTVTLPAVQAATAATPPRVPSPVESAG
ncbi:MAG: HAMP domain-containing sensor histidine kinase [Solirubrobacteraceae bacterium]|nr:HAMP domain-containing sensor histidine kinase [Solirubrobacteraceae bacterium]